MRILIFSRLTTDPAIAAVFGDRIYERSSLGVGPVPERPDFPYLLIGEDGATVYQEVQETGNARGRTFRLTAHDEVGDYLRIERGLALVRQNFKALVPGTASPSGARFMGLTHLGESQDLTDESKQSSYKYSMYRFTSNS